MVKGKTPEYTVPEGQRHFQNMFYHNILRGHTLDPGKLNIILIQLVYHISSGPQRIVGNGG